MLGAISILIASVSQSLFELITYGLTLFIPFITLPFLAGFMGLKGDAFSFFSAAFASLITFFVAKFSLGQPIEFIALLSMIVNGVVFFGVHYIKNGRFVTIEPSWREKEEMKGLTLISSWKKGLRGAGPIFSSIRNYSIKRVNRYGSRHTLFGAFFCLNYMVPIFMWTYEEPPYYLAMFILRVIGGLLCVGLLLRGYWPAKWQQYFPSYWHLTIVYCLPFMATAMFLLVGGTSEWLVNVTITILLLTWLVDWLSFFIMSFIGIFLGSLFGLSFSYLLNIPFTSLINLDYASSYLLGYTCFFCTLLGLVFFHKKQGDTDEILESLSLFSQVVAHEVKNVVGLSKSYASVLSMCTNDMQIQKETIEKNRYGEEVTMLLIKLERESYETLLENIENIKRENTRGLNVIGRMLMNMRKAHRVEGLDICSAAKAVYLALENYGLNESQKRNIEINLEHDFQFRGSENYLQHILFNLLKNSYKFGNEDCKLRLWLEDNKLYFEDDGPGIKKENRPYIFDRFYTTDSTGMGMGLSFCKNVIEALGGSILCESRCKEEGGNSYTLFTLEFPKVNGNIGND